MLDLILRGGLAPSRRQRADPDRRAAGSCPTSAGRSSGSSSRPTAPRYHDGEIAREDDAERQALLEAAGERVIRVRWEQAVCRETQTLRADPRRRSAVRLALAVEMISTNQFKNGNHIEVEGTIFKILEFQHVKPGKGGAFVRTKLRRAADGAVIDRTFRAGEKFRPVRTEARKMQFLYADGTDAHFMDEESYEQIALPETSVAEPLKYIKPNESVDLLYIDDEPGGHPARRVGRARGHAHGAGHARRHGVGRRHQARHAGDRRDRQRAAVRQHRGPGQGGHALGLLHVARLRRSAWPGGPNSAGRRSSRCTSTT